MERLTFKLNGTDYSSAIHRYGFSCTYVPRDGGRGGIMQDGSKTVDILDWKAVISLNCNAIRSDVQAHLIRACKTDYVTITYFDPESNADRTSTFIPSIGNANIGLFRPGNEKWFTGLTLTFEEK